MRDAYFFGVKRILHHRFWNFAFDSNCISIANAMYHVEVCAMFKTRRFKVVRHHMQAILLKVWLTKFLPIF